VSLRHAIAELTSFWGELPALIGDGWPDLADELLDAVDLLAASASDQDYAIRAATVLRLLRPYEQVRVRLVRALQLDDIRSSSPTLSPRAGWAARTHRLAAVAAKAARGEPDESAARWIYARFGDQEGAAPLLAGRTYELIFGVDGSPALDAVSLPSDLRFGPGDEETGLSVRLFSDDAEIEPVESTITVPRAGPSVGHATFLVTPRHPGVAVLTAVFLRDGNFVQLMTIKADIRELTGPETSAIGRPLAVAATLAERQLTIVMTRTPAGCEIIVSAQARWFRARIGLSEAEFDDIALEARRALREIVKLPQAAGSPDDEHGLVYQSRIDIPDSVHQQALMRLCAAGYVMYQRLFFGAGADSQLKKLGTRLQELLNGPPMRVQVISDRPALPWQLFCPAQECIAEDAALDHIVGFRHEVDYLPLDSSADGPVLDTAVDTAAGIRALLAVNEDIDKNGARRLVADQLDYWQRRATRGGLQVGVCRDRDEVIAALADSGRADQILYFYCHAGPGEPRVGAGGIVTAGGPLAGELTFTDNGAVLLRELYTRAPMRQVLGGNPVVVLNACESAALTMSFYEGFVPYLIAKGARGVVGTETVVPAVFAASWAGRFFDRLLSGQRIGAAVLAVRRELATEHRNVLGLLYGVYCDGDTVLRPGLQASGE
jgi:hypothetical protein